MQTFLPYASYQASAGCLDWRRLGKQRVEAKQIILALEDPTYGWQHHPAVKMWRGFTSSLALYGWVICGEWKDRGYVDRQQEFFERRVHDCVYAGTLRPPWLGDEAFHASHRANLLRKAPDVYRSFGWSEDPTLPYIWPVV